MSLVLGARCGKDLKDKKRQEETKKDKKRQETKKTSMFTGAIHYNSGLQPEIFVLEAWSDVPGFYKSGRCPEESFQAGVVIFDSSKQFIPR